MDTDHALRDGDKDLVLWDDVDLSDGPLAEVLVWPEQLDLGGRPGPHDHAILQEAPLGRADKQVVTITENGKMKTR